MKSIRLQILIYLMIGSITLFGLLFILSNNKLEELPFYIEKQYIEVAKARADELSEELDGLIQPIKLISQSSVIKSMDIERIKAILPELKLEEKYRSMTIADLDGNAWSTDLYDLNISEEEQFDEIFIKGMNHHISQPFNSEYIEAESNPILTVSHAIKNDLGKNVGIVNGVVEIKFLDAIINSIELSKDGYSWIVNKDGTLVSHTEMDDVFGKRIVDFKMDENDGIIRMLENQENRIEYKNNLGTQVIAFSSPIKNSPGWIFVISMNEEDLFKEINSIKFTILGSIIIGVLLLLVFSFYYSNKLTKPILNLKHTFESASNGNLNVRADESSPNELGQAAESFNKMLDQIKDLTYNDIITGVYNYNGFVIETKYILSELENNKKFGAVMIISIDDFKSINSLHGYSLGDRILREFSQTLKTFTKEGEVLARFLGDEFIIFFQEDEEVNLRRRIDSLWGICNGVMTIVDTRFVLKTSVGVGIRELKNLSINELIHEATIAKLRVKKSGGNEIEFYDSKLEEDIIREQKIEDSLYDAIKNEELHLAFQPIIDSLTGEVVLMEALLRWNSPIHGNISPVKIIEIAERNGFIIKIGDWVLRQACLKNKQLQDEGYKPIKVAVNVSAIQFQQLDFPDIVKNILDETGMEGKYLELEITETNIMDRVESKIKTMKMLKKMGISISVDDFGTGYSSLSYLTRFPIDILKIDKYFIQSMLDDESSKTIVSTIISMAKSIKLSIVAEGVETEEQLNHLQNEGCHKIQGYLISKPTGIEEMKKILDHRNH